MGGTFCFDNKTVRERVQQLTNVVVLLVPSLVQQYTIRSNIIVPKWEYHRCDLISYSKQKRRSILLTWQLQLLQDPELSAVSKKSRDRRRKMRNCKCCWIVCPFLSCGAFTTHLYVWSASTVTRKRQERASVSPATAVVLLDTCYIIWQYQSARPGDTCRYIFVTHVRSKLSAGTHIYRAYLYWTTNCTSTSYEVPGATVQYP